MMRNRTPDKPIIYIEGDEIVYNEISSTRRLKLKDYVEKVAKKDFVIKTPILPRGCLMYERRPDGKDYYYIHLPMGYYTFNIKDDKHADASTIYTKNVLMPHCILQFQFKGGFMESHAITWSLEENFDLEKNEWRTIKLQNIFKNIIASVCLGPTTGGINHKEIIDNFTRSFLSNEFNGDLSKTGFFIKEVARDQEKMKEKGLPIKDLLHRWLYPYDDESNTLLINDLDSQYRATAFKHRVN